MLILALEFSSAQRTAALAEHSGSTRVLGMVSDRGVRGSGPLPLVQSLLQDLGVARESISCLAAGLGPGSYTGIRSAIAIAQGWQLAREIRLAGVSSADSLALQARENGLRGRVRAIIDAQRGEIYAAGYEISAEREKLVEPLRLAKPDELRSAAAAPQTVLIGPEVTRWFPGGRVLFPEAQAVARLAGAQIDTGRIAPLEPIYLRQAAFVKAPPPRPIPF